MVGLVEITRKYQQNRNDLPKIWKESCTVITKLYNIDAETTRVDERVAAGRTLKNKSWVYGEQLSDN